MLKEYNMVKIDKVKELLMTVCPYDEEEIFPESDLINDLELDSFGLVDLVVAFEKEFSISIPDRDLRLFTTVQDIVDYLEEKTQN